jgi:beta propeller repeat protein
MKQRSIVNWKTSVMVPIVLIALVVGVITVVGPQIGAPYGKYLADYRGTSIASSAVFPSTANQTEPEIDASYVVWSEQVGNYWQIMLYDLGSKQRQQLTNDMVDHVSPYISGDIAVWGEGGRGRANHLAAMNVVTHKRIPLPSEGAADWCLHSGLLVWVGETASLDSAIVVYDFNTGDKTTIVKSLARSPSTDGHTIVWEDLQTSNSDVYGYDVATGRQFPIAVAVADQRQPQVFGNLVVWQDDRATNAVNQTNIYAYDLSSRQEHAVSTRSGDEISPKLSDQFIVWTDLGGGYVDVHGYSLAKQTIFTIAADDYENAQPAIWKNVVVWTRSERLSSSVRNSQIMIATIPSSY